MPCKALYLLRASGQAADVDAPCGPCRLGVEHLISSLHLGCPRPVVRQRACRRKRQHCNVWLGKGACENSRPQQCSQAILGVPAVLLTWLIGAPADASISSVQLWRQPCCALHIEEHTVGL
jgi:hypothetical protein